MKTLTLWPEWAHAVAWLGKPIENRDWPALWMLGKRFAIHAGAHIGGRKGIPATREGMESLWDSKPESLEFRWGTLPPRTVHGGAMQPIVTSAILCTAVLAKCERNEDHARLFVPGRVVPPWGNPESKYWWHLEDVEVLPEPVPCKGAQGFWEWTP